MSQATESRRGRLVGATEVRRAIHEAVGSPVRREVVDAIVADLHQSFEEMVQTIVANHAREVESQQYHFATPLPKPMVSLRHLTVRSKAGVS